jgi:hypothetical protein
MTFQSCDEILDERGLSHSGHACNQDIFFDHLFKIYPYIRRNWIRQLFYILIQLKCNAFSSEEASCLRISFEPLFACIARRAQQEILCLPFFCDRLGESEP